MIPDHDDGSAEWLYSRCVFRINGCTEAAVAYFSPGNHITGVCAIHLAVMHGSCPRCSVPGDLLSDFRGAQTYRCTNCGHEYTVQSSISTHGGRPRRAGEHH